MECAEAGENVGRTGQMPTKSDSQQNSENNFAIELV